MLIGCGIAVFISFINLFLEPFKTAESSKILVLGYSLCFLISYIIAYALEYFLFQKLKPVWANRTGAFFISLFALSSLSIYGYDLLVIKSIPFTWEYYLSFVLRVLVPFGLLVLPMVYLARAAKIIVQQSPDQDGNEIIIKGASSGEVLHTTTDKLLYARADNNYCRIIYLDSNGKVSQKLFRIKISDLVKEIDCLTRCHRGYAINMDNVAQVNQSQTKASVQLKWTNEVIPVSRSYMKSIAAD